MEFRLGVPADLAQIREMFGRIVQDMRRQNITIWDEVYPLDWFEGDILAGQLYVVYAGPRLVCAFVLCDSIANKETPAWQQPDAKALYLYRLGVDPACGGAGVGSFAMQKAMESAKAMGAEYLRLLVVDSNLPALRFYEKNGFTRIPGMYDQLVQGQLQWEYGYEKKL